MPDWMKIALSILATTAHHRSSSGLNEREPIGSAFRRWQDRRLGGTGCRVCDGNAQ
jgi:hypothetical protein